MQMHDTSLGLEPGTVYRAEGSGPHGPVVFSFAFTTRHSDPTIRGATDAPRLMQELRGVGPEPQVLRLRQVHGTQVQSLAAATAGCEADGWLLDRPQPEVAAILVADCLPVALFAPSLGLAALAHCGHRGLSGRLLEAAARILRAQDAGAPLEAWLGPCIGACCYQVQADVADRFAAWPDALGPDPVRGFRLDLQKAAQLQLTELGVTLRGAVRECTHCRPERYWSYRRGDRNGGRQSLLGTLQRRP